MEKERVWVDPETGIMLTPGYHAEQCLGSGGYLAVKYYDARRDRF